MTRQRNNKPIGFLFLARCPVACAQLPISPLISPEDAARFDHPQTQGVLQCRVTPLRPVLDFSFRFQAGYTIQVPLNQFSGRGHHWTVVTRVQPDRDGTPAYFLDRLKLPEILSNHAEGEAGGAYVSGEGNYRASLALTDDEGLVCRAEWTIQAKADSGSRNVKIAIPPGTVQEISLRNTRSVQAPRETPAGKLTVLLHAAPVSPRMSKVQANDAAILLGALSSLLDLAPARSVRLVVFSLAQGKEIYRQDNFTLDRLEAVRQAIFDLQLATIDYRQLQNPSGHLDLLNRLVSEELHAESPADTVIFPGSHSRVAGKTAFQLEKQQRITPNFYYLEYLSPRPITAAAARDEFAGGIAMASQPKPTQTNYDPNGSGNSVIPDPSQIGLINGAQRFGPARDSIDELISRLKGKTFAIGTPAEFARAIQQITKR